MKSIEIIFINYKLAFIITAFSTAALEPGFYPLISLQSTTQYSFSCLPGYIWN
jgi:hypothetical protein